jgi:hypothetical protein
MKKALVLFSVVALGSLATVKAQQGGMDPAAMKERMEKQKQNLKQQLSFSDAQADSAVNIQMEFMQQRRALRDLSQEERQAKGKEIMEAMHKRYTSALGADNAKKLEDYQAEQMKNRMQGGGRPQGGGGN